MSSITGSALFQQILDDLGLQRGSDISDIFFNLYAARIDRVYSDTDNRDPDFSAALILMNSTPIRTNPNVSGIPDNLVEVVETAKARIDDPSDQPPATDYILHEATDQTVEQALQGTDGVKDIFVLNYSYDLNGGFSSFGQVTINGYNKADGDVIVFVDQNNTENITISDFTNEVQPQAGHAKIIFGIYPDQDHNDQWIKIIGAETQYPFANKVEDIIAVDFVNTTQQHLDTVGSVAEILSIG